MNTIPTKEWKILEDWCRKNPELFYMSNYPLRELSTDWERFPDPEFTIWVEDKKSE